MWICSLNELCDMPTVQKIYLSFTVAVTIHKTTYKFKIITLVVFFLVLAHCAVDSIGGAGCKTAA